MKTFLCLAALTTAFLPRLVFGLEIIPEVQPLIQRSLIHGRLPIAVFDLDETLIDSIPRRTLSIREAAGALLSAYPVEAKKLLDLTPETGMSLQNRYSISELTLKLQIQNPSFTVELEKALLKSYLSAKYMDYDREIPCSAYTIQKLESLGVLPVFISSRYSSQQLSSTLTSLLRLGIRPQHSNSRVILRPDGMNSIDFKTEAFRQVLRIGVELNREVDIILAVENEPENMNAMLEVFEDAKTYFVRGAFLKDIPLAPNGEEQFKRLTFINDYCPN